MSNFSETLDLAAECPGNSEGNFYATSSKSLSKLLAVLSWFTPESSLLSLSLGSLSFF